MKIFTYYENVPGISGYDSIKLIQSWREAWTACGFEPLVITEHHARKHPDFEKFEALAKALPSVNSAQYEFACYARWLALCQVGGGFLADYDLFPRNFDENGGLRGFPSLTGVQLGKLNIFQNHNVCPCFCYASANTAKRVCETIVSTTLGRRKIGEREHVSDQYVFEDLVLAGVDWIETHDVVREYGDAEWLNRPMVHLSNACMTPAGKVPRWKFVKEILA